MDWQFAVLVLGVVMAAVLGFQLWRAAQLEARLRSTEAARALLLGERILQRAAGSERVAAELDGGHRLQLRAGRCVVDSSIAWLEPVAAEAEDDLVVGERLARAAQAEFVERDHAAAAYEFDELLDGPLRTVHRLRVLAAATWHARRAALDGRAQRLAAALGEAVAALEPDDLRSPTAAGAVAAAARLGERALAPADAARLLPFLPPVAFASIDPASIASGTALTAEHERVVARRDALVEVERRLAPALPRTAGLHALTAERVLWVGRAPVDADVRDAVATTPAAWLEALRRAGARDPAFALPARVQPEFAAATEATFAGTPGVVRLVPRDEGLGAPAWLAPALAALLVLGFAAAFVQQRRGARRERAALTTQARFLTTVTHELKTPLAGIRLLGEMLAEGRASGREAEYYRLLVGEAARLSMLIDNVLDLGRLERGERRYATVTTPLGPVVDEAVRMFGPVLERAGLRVAFADDTARAEVALDRDAFVQAFVAVLDNAGKYGRDGGEVDVRVAAAARAVEVVVRDRGPGVPAAERERVFERFARGDAHRHGSTPGVGIGLYLARTIARRLGGDLRCESPADGGPGARFVFSFPRPDPTRTEPTRPEPIRP